MQLEKIFIGFRNRSFDEIVNLNVNNTISGREKLVLRTICENATEAISVFIKETKASKLINEDDFDWSIKLYTFVCVQELFDILDSMKKIKNDSNIRDIQDIKEQNLLNHLKKIIGGDDIELYIDKVSNVIKTNTKENTNYNEFLISRILIISNMCTENSVNFEKLSSEKLLSVAEKNYNDSLLNFVKICV